MYDVSDLIWVIFSQIQETPKIRPGKCCDFYGIWGGGKGSWIPGSQHFPGLPKITPSKDFRSFFGITKISKDGSHIETI